MEDIHKIFRYVFLCWSLFLDMEVIGATNIHITFHYVFLCLSLFPEMEAIGGTMAVIGAVVVFVKVVSIMLLGLFIICFVLYKAPSYLRDATCNLLVQKFYFEKFLEIVELGKETALGIWEEFYEYLQELDDDIYKAVQVAEGRLLEVLKGVKKFVGVGDDDDIKEEAVDECRETGRPIFREQESPVEEIRMKLSLREEIELIEVQKNKDEQESPVKDTREVKNEGEDSKGTEGDALHNREGNGRNDQAAEEELFDDWEGIERTELEKRFDAAVTFVGCESNANRIDDNIRMQLYGFQRVAMEGPCHAPQPMALKVYARAKWNAWQKVGDMSEDMAMEQYMILLSERIPGWEDEQ